MRRGVVATAILAVLVAGCSAKTPTGVSSPPVVDPSTSISPSASTTPKKRKPLPKARRVVSILPDGVWLYDVAKDESKRISSSAGLRMPRWVSRESFSFVEDSGGAGALMLFNFKTGELTKLFEVRTGIAAYGWSPDRETVAYVTVDGRGYPQIHYRSIVGEGATQTVATLARALGREGTDDDQTYVEFSKDGKRVLVVYTPADGTGEVTPEQSRLQVRTIDGTLDYAPTHEDAPTMGVWAPDGSRVWFRTNAGARSWMPSSGKVTPAGGKPRWFNPSVARDGKRIAFDTGGSNEGVRARILEVATGRISTVSKAARFHPVFADNATLWVQRVKRCSGDCLVQTIPADEVFAIALKTGKERKLALKSLVDADVLYY